MIFSWTLKMTLMVRKMWINCFISSSSKLLALGMRMRIRFAVELDIICSSCSVADGGFLDHQSLAVSSLIESVSLLLDYLVYCLTSVCNNSIFGLVTMFSNVYFKIKYLLFYTYLSNVNWSLNYHNMPFEHENM